MVSLQDLRPGEVTVDMPKAFDGGIYFIGRIHTPWSTSSDWSGSTTTWPGPGPPASSRAAWSRSRSQHAACMGTTDI